MKSIAPTGCRRLRCLYAFNRIPQFAVFQFAQQLIIRKKDGDVERQLHSICAFIMLSGRVIALRLRWQRMQSTTASCAYTRECPIRAFVARMNSLRAAFSYGASPVESH
jgi:hypothetical protein